MRGTVLILLLAPIIAAAQEKRLLPARPTAYPVDHTMERAGMPQELSRWAKPGIEKHESPGLIGGGRAWRGDAAGPGDGTFGWDYSGWRPGRVFLGFGRDRNQSDLGPYRTDGHRVPNVFAIQPVRRVLQPRDP